MMHRVVGDDVILVQVQKPIYPLLFPLALVLLPELNDAGEVYSWAVRLIALAYVYVYFYFSIWTKPLLEVHPSKVVIRPVKKYSQLFGFLSTEGYAKTEHFELDQIKAVIVNYPEISFETMAGTLFCLSLNIERTEFDRLVMIMKRKGVGSDKLTLTG